MTTYEFSEQFDTLIHSHLLTEPFGNVSKTRFDEYEKSVYLTNAQNELVVELYTGRNSFGGAYEENEEIRRYLSDLNKTELVTSFRPLEVGIGDKSYGVRVDKPILYITFESCKITTNDDCYQTKVVECIPIRRDEYNRIKDNPFKNGKVWRVDHSYNRVELITKHKLREYKIGYLTYPDPIILENISPLKIEGISSLTESPLNTILHKYVLERAVQNAIRDIVRMVSNTDN